MRHSKLRIAWSVGWGAAAVLLIVLWVRSYWSCDYAFWVNTEYKVTTIGSSRGFLCLARRITLVPGIAPTKLHFQSQPKPWPLGWEWRWSAEKTAVYVPHCLLATVVGLLGALPWLRQVTWRFSLRTLLIATTLVAVALGAIIYAVK